MAEKLRILDDCNWLMFKVFEATKKHPEWKFTINDQLTRSALSIGSNIAEANQRLAGNKRNLFNVALGSLEECRFQFGLYPEYTEEINTILNKIRAVTLLLMNYKPKS